MSSAFNQLSDGLAPDEKRDLLDKIHSGLNWSQKDAEAIIPATPPKDEIQQKLKQDAQKLHFFHRLLYHFIAFFMGITIEELVFRNKVHHLKRNIADTANGLVVWETNLMTDVMGKAVYDLYAATYLLEPVFQTLAKKSSIMEKTVTDLLESLIPNVRTGVFDFVSLSEMGDLYRASGQKARIHKRVKESIGPWIDQVPEEIYKQVREFVSPIYLFKPMILFPFHTLLEAFGVNQVADEPKKYPPMRSAYMRGLTDFLEKLYYALYLANKVEYRDATWRPLFQNVLNETQEKDRSVDDYIGAVKSLQEECLNIFREIPWKEVLQALNENPYYAMRFYLPQFDVKTFYKASLTVRFASQVEEIFPELRKNIIEKEKSALFQNQNSQLLAHYNWEINSEIRSLGGRAFRHIESLNLINTFLLTHYIPQILPLLQTLSRVVLQPFKVTNNSLLQAMADIDAVKAEILDFDRGLHSENPDGLQLMRLKQELRTRPLAVKAFAEFSARKDKESRKLVEEFHDTTNRMKRVLDEVLEHTSEKMRHSLKLPYIMGGSKRKMSEVIAEKASTLWDLLKLLNDLFTEEEAREGG